MAIDASAIKKEMKRKRGFSLGGIGKYISKKKSQYQEARVSSLEKKAEYSKRREKAEREIYKLEKVQTQRARLRESRPQKSPLSRLTGGNMGFNRPNLGVERNATEATVAPDIYGMGTNEKKKKNIFDL